MAAHNENRSLERNELVRQLADSILQTAEPLIDPETDRAALDRMTDDIKERLSFESNVLLNEVVTKFSTGRAPKGAEERPERTFERFGKNFRAQHMLMIVSVITLIITGMPLKFPELGISKFIILTLFGGLENSTLVHRVGAVGLITVGVWHLGYSFMARVGWRDFLLMIPRLQDIKDFIRTIQYYIGRKPSGPKFGRFSFIEKFDYWAVYWGMIIMIGSGLIMWFKEYFSKFLFDIGREAHSDEGLLATLAIVIWHFYNVHFNPEVFPMSWAWWHGELTEAEMKHHHPLEYAEIIAEEKEAIVSEAEKTAATGGSES